MDVSKELIDQVWRKASVVLGLDPNQKRSDVCGAIIAKASYGMQTEYGWEIDHCVPTSRGGNDHQSNLQPLHWQNNRAKSDGPNQPSLFCVRKK